MIRISSFCKVNPLSVALTKIIYGKKFLNNFKVNVMKLSIIVLLLLAMVLLSTGGQALRTYSGDVISIDTPVDDDVFAAGNVVNINAPVKSATTASGTLNINAPVAGNVIAVGGQLRMNSDVGGSVIVAGGNVNLEAESAVAGDIIAAGGQLLIDSNVSQKVVAAGGNIDLGGKIGTNAVVAGGQVNILPEATIGRDAQIEAENVYHAGRVNGTLTVRAEAFQNNGTAGRTDFQRTEAPRREEARGGVNVFGILTILGYLILGLILVRTVPGLFLIVDAEIRKSPVIRTLIGFVLLIASFVAIFIVAITVIGLPIAAIAAMLLVVAWMLTGTFVSFSLGIWIADLLKKKLSNTVVFLIGFVILNILFLIPYLGGLIGLISLSLGFAALLYAVRYKMQGLSMEPEA